jgi:hypothetical protein
MAATGTEILAAVKKAAAWGTAASVGANTGVLLLSESLVKKCAEELDEAAGQAFHQEDDKGLITVQGDLVAQARYDGLTTLLAMALGTAGAPAQQGATAAYLHLLQLASKTDGLFATAAIDKITQIQEWPALKVLGFTLKGDVGKPCELTFPCAADDLLSPAVTNTSLASVTYRDRSNRLLFSQAVFRINAQSGAALDSGDIITPSGFELKFLRKLAGDYLAGGANKIGEPLNDGMPDITLDLKFPVFKVATWPVALQADTRYKMDITFTGKLIAGAYYYSLTISFPHLSVADTSAPMSGPGKIANPVTFRVLKASAAPTGMAYTLPMTLALINTQTTDALA